MKNFTTKTILTLSFVISSLNIFSQIINKEFILKQVSQNTKYIFETKNIQKVKSFRADNNMIYTQYSADITRQVFGEKTTDKIYLIIEGGQIEENGSINGTSNPHGLDIRENVPSSVFCTNFSDSNVKNAYYITEQVCYTNTDIVYETNNLSKYYNNQSINNLYADLSKIIATPIFEKKSQIISVKVDAEEKPTPELYLNNDINYNNHISFFETKKKTKSIVNKTLATDLTISTANEQITASGAQRFFEFDVVVKTNVTNAYFDNCLIRLQYNSTAFGSNIKAAGTATITKGSAFNSLTYIDPNTNFIDQTSNTLGIPFGINYSVTPLSRTILSTTNKTLLHVRMKIIGCNENSDLQFVDASSISFLNFYTNTANAAATAGNSFDNSYYLTPPNILLCTVIVDNFNPTINGGTNEIFTITGFNFGTTNGKVRFRNANNGPNFPFLQNVDNNDIISWTNTEIKLKMPSTTVLNGSYNNPGSGAFIVKNSIGDSTVAYFNSTTFEPLKIHYSIENKVIAPNKFRMYLKNQNTQGGYTIRLDSSIANYPERKGCVIKAINEWRCKAGANLTLGTTINGVPTPTSDAITTIAFTPTTVIGQVAGTFQQWQSCTNSGTTTVATTDFDTRISRQYQYFYDTTGVDLPPGKYDFYEIITHEIGHGLGLAHVIDTTQIMYYTTKMHPNGDTLDGSLRRVLKIYSGDTDGVLDQGSDSPLNIHSQCTNYASYSMINTACVVGIEELSKSNFNIIVYPNPSTDGVINLSFDAYENSKPIIEIYNLLGSKVFSENVISENGSNHYIKTLNVDSLNSGIYILNVVIGNNKATYKIVKQ